MFASTAEQYDFRAIILLTDRNRSRNKKLCAAYLETLAPGDVAKETVPGAKLIPTYWPTIGAASPMNCEAMLQNYDYDAAKVLLQVYGIGNAKGPVFVIADRKNNFAFVDLSKASNNQIRETVVGWYRSVRANGLQNVALTSPNFLAVLGKVVCGVTTEVVRQQTPPEGSNLEDPATWGWDGQRWTKPSLFKLGSLLFGGTIVDAACGIADVITVVPQPSSQA